MLTEHHFPTVSSAYIKTAYSYNSYGRLENSTRMADTAVHLTRTGAWAVRLNARRHRGCRLPANNIPLCLCESVVAFNNGRSRRWRDGRPYCARAKPRATGDVSGTGAAGTGCWRIMDAPLQRGTRLYCSLFPVPGSRFPVTCNL
jgi:hypothetical protein